MDKKERKHSNSEDATLFRDAVADARPLQTPARHLPPKSRSPRAELTRRAETEALEASWRDDPAAAEPDLSDELIFHRGSVTRRMLRELRRGKYAVQAELDLHGCTRDEARQQLQAFMEMGLRQRLRCVRVVHGKGKGSGPAGPVLRVAVNGWLRRWNEVLAFCPARNCDGGTGAMYVLLRAG